MGTLLRDYSNSNNYHCQESHSSLLASGHVYSLSLREVRVRTSLIAPCTPAPPPVSEPNPFQPKTVRNHIRACARGRGCTSPFLCACVFCVSCFVFFLCYYSALLYSSCILCIPYSGANYNSIQFGIACTKSTPLVKKNPKLTRCLVNLHALL